MNLLELDVDIRDSKAFEAIDLDKFLRFVEGTGWVVKTIHENFSILQKKFDNEWGRIWIPKTHVRQHGDYTSTVKAAFSEVAKREAIPQLVLLQKLIGGK